jgi:hypothetical protein
LFGGVRGRQIAGRFTLIASTPFAYGTTEQRTAWRSLIATLEATLRLHQHTPEALVSLDEQQRAGRRHGLVVEKTACRVSRCQGRPSCGSAIPAHRSTTFSPCRYTLTAAPISAPSAIDAGDPADSLPSACCSADGCEAAALSDGRGR